MSTNRRLRPKTDSNQPDIVKELRRLGYSVQVYMEDILIGKDGVNWQVEIKDPARTLRKDGRIKPDIFKKSQIDLLRDWQGQYDVCWSLEEILSIIDQP